MMHTNNPQNHARHQVGLTVALIILISAASLATGPIRSASAQADAPRWSYTGSLNTARTSHSATPLPNGKVLVAGGQNETGTLDSAELYDPVTGTWSITGRLNAPRFRHTATLLQNGIVLIAGGDDERESLNTAELYDPATETWSFTGNLNITRNWHTATLLQNGKVLIAGGDTTDYIAINAAELYDPTTGTWSLTGKLNEGRLFHTATLLANGKVLVGGGAQVGENDWPLGSTELYDPETGSWSFTGSLNTKREYHTAVLLPSGNVLVAGGEWELPSYGESELYNVDTGKWSYTGSISRRYNHTMTLLANGKALIAGGRILGVGIDVPYDLNNANIYDPATGYWKKTADLNAPRAGHTATLLSTGKVLVVGGYDRRFGSDGPQPSAELYDPEMLDPAPTAPRIIMASVSGKKLFITGENFHPGAVILLNGEEQKTKQPAANPQTTLIGKKAGKKIKQGNRVQVRNPDGTLSEEFIFTDSLTTAVVNELQIASLTTAAVCNVGPGRSRPM